MKIALVHDYLVQGGGAERVLKAFADTFPEAPIYTLLHDRELMRGAFDGHRIITSSLQNLPFAKKRHRNFPALMPSAIEEFDFSLYDVVLSDSSSFAKGIITPPSTLHISYVHTPMRYAWDDCQKYTSDFGLPHLIEKAVPFLMNPIRIWDFASAQRVDQYLANSQFVAKRIKKYYHKDALVINPPVDIDFFRPKAPVKKQDYYLMVGRLIAYKKHDIAIEAFNRLGLPLKIIGRGPELKALKSKANDNIEFLERVDDDKLVDYYAKCKAFVFPQEEDFGIVAIEALASGSPLIAYHGGDIAEHMSEGKQGTFFHSQTPQAIIDAVKKFEKMKFDSEQISNSVESFDTDNFKRTIHSYVSERVHKHIKIRQSHQAKKETSAQRYAQAMPKQ